MASLLDRLGSFVDEMSIIGQTMAQRDAIAAQTQQTAQGLNASLRKTSQKIATESSKSRQDTLQSQLDLLENVQETTDVAQEAMQLASSDNPLDKARLWFLQQTDSRYTRDGNLARLGYLASATQALGIGDQLQQDALAADLQQAKERVANQLEAANDSLAIKELDVQTGQNRLNILQDQIAAQRSIATEQSRLTNEAIDSAPRETLALAVQQAIQDNAGTALLAGGTEVPLPVAQERLAVLEKRANDTVLRRNISIGLKLQDTPDSELQNLLVTAQDGMVTLSDGMQTSVGAVQTELLTRNNTSNALLASNDLSRQALLANQQETIDGLTRTETMSALQNGGKVDGESFDMSALQQHAVALSTQASNQAALISDVAGLQTPTASLADAAAIYDNYLNNAALSPSLRAQLQQGKEVLLESVGMMPEGGDPQTAAITAQGLASSARVFADKAIDAEAVKLSAGNDNVAELFKYQLRGQPIPERVITTVLADSIESGGTVAQWLPQQQAADFLRVYNEKSIELSAPGIASLSAAAIRTTALQAAFTSLRESAVTQWSDTLIGLQATQDIPALQNPLQGVMSPERLMAISQEATLSGQRRALEAFGNGELTPEQQAQAQNMQFMDMLTSLEAEKPGIAKALSEWWDSDKRLAFASAAGGLITKFAAGSVQESVSASIFNAQLPAAMSALNQGYQTAYRTFSTESLRAQRDDLLLFNRNQYNRQLFLTSVSQGLTPEEKVLVQKEIITPLLSQISSMDGYENKTLEEKNQLFEFGLMQFQTDNRAVQSLARKLLSGREAALNILAEFRNANSAAPTDAMPPFVSNVRPF